MLTSAIDLWGSITGAFLMTQRPLSFVDFRPKIEFIIFFFKVTILQFKARKSIALIDNVFVEDC